MYAALNLSCSGYSVSSKEWCHPEWACRSPNSIYNPSQPCKWTHTPVHSRFFSSSPFYKMTAYKISQYATGTEDISWCCISTSIARKHETEHLPLFKHKHNFPLKFVLKLVGKVNSMLWFFVKFIRYLLFHSFAKEMNLSANCMCLKMRM